MSDRPTSYTQLTDAATCGEAEACRRYAEALAHEKAVQERWENYSGNNPNKHRGALKDARFYVGQWHYYVTQIYKVAI